MHRHSTHLARSRALVAAGLVSFLAACSSSGLSGSAASSGSAESSAGTEWFGTRLGSFFSRPAAQASASANSAAGASPSVDVECPGVTVRDGASTLLVNMPNADPSPTNLRYQGTIVRTARECAALGATLTMRIGVQGRIILGPQGGPGSLDVPLRYALVKEGTTPKTLWTRVHLVKVTIPSDRPNVLFSHIEEDLTVPMPPGNEVDDYIVYVGFDPKGAEQRPDRQNRQARPRVAEPRAPAR